jgi:2',3'-cyclic-nucleotide 2'-phosphodiesterase (5'-nucleotidase family)
MERRAGCIARMRAAVPGPLVLDSGNLLFARDIKPAQQELQNAEFLLSSIRHMQTMAVNVSANDCTAGVAFLKKSAGQVTLLSSNVRSSETDELLFKPYLITTLNRVRIGIFGLSEMPGLTGTHGIHVDDPLSSAAPVVAALQRADCDVIVLLSQLTEARNLRLLTEVPGIHFVLGSSDAPARAEPLRSGDGYSIAPGQGTHVAVLECLLEGRGAAFAYAGTKTAEETTTHAQTQQPARGRFTYQLSALDSAVPADPTVELLLETLQENRVRRALQKQQLQFRETVPAVDVKGLPEAGRRRAVRLMNEISCGDRRIADCAADTKLCREMGRLIAEGVRTGQTDGAVQFTVLRDMQARKPDRDIPLDKPALLH